MLLCDDGIIYQNIDKSLLELLLINRINNLISTFIMLLYDDGIIYQNIDKSLLELLLHCSLVKWRSQYKNIYTYVDVHFTEHVLK